MKYCFRIMMILAMGFMGLSWNALAGEAQSNLEVFFQGALQKAEQLANQDQLTRQAEERRTQAISGVLPNLQLLGTYTVQDRSGLSGLRLELAPQINPNVRFNLTQPIFRGFAEYARLRQTKMDSESQRVSLVHAARILYLDVAQSFYAWLGLKSDLLHSQLELDLLKKRLIEVKQRVRVGRSRSSEVLNLEVALSNLESEVQRTQSDLALATQNLVILTGVEGIEPSDAIKDELEISAALTDVEIVENRADVRAAKLRVESAREGVSIAKGGHWPTADIGANYYLDRAGLLETVKWDAFLSFSIPIYTGGLIQSQVRLASSILMQAELSLALLRRQATADLETTRKQLVAAREQILSLKKSKALAERNFQEQSREYRLGLVNNGEVLLSLTGYQEAERALDRSLYNMRVAKYRVQLATGRLLTDLSYENLQTILSSRP
jgi:outer membrane protein